MCRQAAFPTLNNAQNWSVTKPGTEQNTSGSGSQTVLRGFQGIRDQFQGDPWIHFCNDYFEIYLFFN